MAILKKRYKHCTTVTKIKHNLMHVRFSIMRIIGERERERNREEIKREIERKSREEI
jgi:hypothetical protein